MFQIAYCPGLRVVVALPYPDSTTISSQGDVCRFSTEVAEEIEIDSGVSAYARGHAPTESISYQLPGA